jgi:hypothetical protein
MTSYGWSLDTSSLPHVAFKLLTKNRHNCYRGFFNAMFKLLSFYNDVCGFCIAILMLTLFATEASTEKIIQISRPQIQRCSG